MRKKMRKKKAWVIRFLFYEVTKN